MFDDLLLNLWPARVNATERLVWRGRHVSTVFLLQAGDDSYLVKIDAGRIASVSKGPFVMPHWQFALRAPVLAWTQFWSRLPPPGWHDLMAMLKFRHLTMEGDLYPLMSNLLYFKDLLAILRPEEKQS